MRRWDLGVASGGEFMRGFYGHAIFRRVCRITGFRPETGGFRV